MADNANVKPVIDFSKALFRKSILFVCFTIYPPCM
jgi:hypothetical protein